MTVDWRTLTPPAVAAALVVIAGIVWGWHPAAYLVLAAAVLVVGVVALRSLATARKPVPTQAFLPPPPENPRPEPQAGPSQTRIAEVWLPSAHPDYRFGFSATVWFLPTASLTVHADPAALARDAVVTRAAEISGEFPIDDHALVEQRLGALLGTREPEPQRRVQTWATDVVIEIDDRDTDHLARITDQQRRSQLWRVERDHEIDVRTYLQDDVLRSTGRTLVWWLARDYGRVDSAEERLPLFARISAVARDLADPGAIVPDAAVPASPDRATASTDPRVLVEQLLPDLDEDERRMFADELARLADEHARNGLGDRLRTAYGIQHLVDLDDDPLADRRDGETPPGPTPAAPEEVRRDAVRPDPEGAGG